MTSPRRFLLLPAALILIGTAGAYAAPSPPSLIFPEDQRVSSNKTPSFDWSDVAGSTYTLQIATASDFTTVTISSAGMESSSYTATAGQSLTRGGTYYWRVRASDATGDGVYGATQSFHVSLNRVAYTLDVDTSTPFSGPLTVTQRIASPDLIAPTTNQYTLTPGQGLQGGATYYWRVKATDEAGNSSGYSTPDSKLVTGTFPKPVLTAPADQLRILTTTPLLSWASVAGATAYQVDLSTLPDFSLIAYSSANISGTAYQVKPADGLSNSTTYYWSVTATDGVGVSVSSRAFYAETASTTTLVFPENGRLISDKTPSFRWSTPSGPTAGRDLTYTLEWAPNPDMTTGLQTQAAISTDSYTLSALQALTRGATYYWRVRMLDNIGTALVASTRTINVSRNRIAYTLDVDTSTPFSGPLTVTQQIASPDLIAPTANQFALTPAQALANGGTYYWRVKATDEAGNSGGYSTPDSKLVIATLPSPVLTTPADRKRIITTTPLLSWGSVAGATSYTVSVSTRADFSLIYFAAASIPGTSYQTVTADGLLTLTTYYWSVSATDGIRTSVSSRAFSIETISPPNLIFPEDARRISDKTPSFQWSTPSGPSAGRDLTYTLDWGTNASLTTPLSQPLISTDNYTLSALQVLARGTTYFWRVKAQDNIGTTLVSSTNSFLVSANRVVYALEIDTTTPLTPPLTLSSTMTGVAYGLAPAEALSNAATSYYWRVRAVDAAGNSNQSADAPFGMVLACPTVRSVCASGCYYNSIQAAVNGFAPSLSGYTCVMVTDSSAYPEQVTIANFVNNGSSITVLSDPSLPARPTVSPPLGSTAAFVIANDSVNIQGIDAVPANPMTYGVLASSAYVRISSVNVLDASGKISVAGIRAADWNTVSYATVSVASPGATALSLVGTTMTTIEFSSARATGASGYALSLSNASSNTVTGSFLSGGSGGALFVSGSNSNSVVLSTMTGTFALQVAGSTGNSLSQSWILGTSRGAWLETGANGTSITRSTMTAGSGGYGFEAQSASASVVSSSYIQGSTAAYIFGSTGTVIAASVLAATDPGGDALTFLGGSVNLTVTGSTLTSAGGRGAALEAGNGGVLSLSSDTFQGGVQCLFIAAQQAGTTVWISSNLVLPILEANPLPLTYGIYLNGLTTGATIYDNEVYYRTAASNLNNTANPLYATGSTGLLIERNRFNSAGAISNGSLSVVTLSASQNVGISFNDFNFSVGGLNNVYGLQIIGSTATVTNNVFNFSGSASSRFDLWVNATSGIKTDYNDWYAGGAGLSMTWGSAYTSLSGWQATGQDAHSLSADPLWPNLTAGSEDFHPRSVRGRCSTPNSYTPTSPFSCTGYSTDTVHSPTIDAGDPARPFDLEPVPHGRRVNIGSYGNTPEASESRRKLQVILIQ